MTVSLKKEKPKPKETLKPKGKPKKAKPKAKEKTKKSLKELRDLLLLAKGGDPEAQDLLYEFLNLEYPQERTNFPAMIYVQKQTYLLMCAEHFGLEVDEDTGEVIGGYGKPFYDMANFDSITWGGYKGFKADRVVEMLKHGTDMSDMLMSFSPSRPQEPKKPFWKRDKQKGEQLDG